MKVFNYDDAAVLRFLGYECTSIGRDDRNRVFVEFDPDTEGTEGNPEEAIREHNSTGIVANSQDLLEAAQWARQRFKAANELVPRKWPAGPHPTQERTKDQWT